MQPARQWRFGRFTFLSFVGRDSREESDSSVAAESSSLSLSRRLDQFLSRAYLGCAGPCGLFFQLSGCFVFRLKPIHQRSDPLRGEEAFAATDGGR